MVSFEKLISIITLNKKLYIYSYFFYFCFILLVFFKFRALIAFCGTMINNFYKEL